jgi:hypothetical protein
LLAVTLAAAYENDDAEDDDEADAALGSGTALRETRRRFDGLLSHCISRKGWAPLKATMAEAMALRKAFLRSFWRTKKGIKGSIKVPAPRRPRSKEVARTGLRASLRAAMAALYLFHGMHGQGNWSQSVL